MTDDVLHIEYPNWKPNARRPCYETWDDEIRDARLAGYSLIQAKRILTDRDRLYAMSSGGIFPLQLQLGGDTIPAKVLSFPVYEESAEKRKMAYTFEREYLSEFGGFVTLDPTNALVIRYTLRFFLGKQVYTRTFQCTPEQEEAVGRENLEGKLFEEMGGMLYRVHIGRAEGQEVRHGEESV